MRNDLIALKVRGPLARIRSIVGARKVRGRCAGGARKVRGRCAGGARKV